MNKIKKTLIGISLVLAAGGGYVYYSINQTRDFYHKLAVDMLTRENNDIIRQQNEYGFIRKFYRSRTDELTKDIDIKMESLPKDADMKERFNLALEKWNKTLPFKYEELKVITDKIGADQFTDILLLTSISKDLISNVYEIKAYDYSDEYKIPDDLHLEHIQAQILIANKASKFLQRRKSFRASYNDAVSHAGLDLNKYLIKPDDDINAFERMTEHFAISNITINTPIYHYYVGRILPEVLEKKKENRHISTKDYNFLQCLALYNTLGPDWSCPNKDEAIKFMQERKANFKNQFKDY